MLGSPSTVLLLSPHTDDAEFGCGATISRLVEDGCDVYSLVFSACEQSVPDGYPQDVLRHEVLDAGDVLGIDRQRISVLDLKVREFSYHRQRILDEMISARKRIKPDLVIAPGSTDVHQDHQVIHQESVRAFRGCSMLGYELIWNGMELRADFFVSCRERDLATKLSAIAAYKSQAFRVYSDETTIRSIARTRGLQAGLDYAEAFELIRWVES